MTRLGLAGSDLEPSRQQVHSGLLKLPSGRVVALHTGFRADVDRRPVVILDPQEGVLAGMHKIIGKQTDPLHRLERGQRPNDDSLALNDRGDAGRLAR